MLRQALMYQGIFLSDKDFKVVMDSATEDIKFNQVLFKRRPNLDEVVGIVASCARAWKRCV